MFRPDSLIFYCDDVMVSTAFYQTLLAQEPLERFEGFSVFALDDHFILGLQDKHSITPSTEPSFGGVELSMTVESHADVDRLFEILSKIATIALPPCQLEFGYSCVVLDPDGHRLRICATDTSRIERYQ